MPKILPVSFLFLLSGCVAAPVIVTGVGVASVVATETTGRTITDHAVSAISSQDCRLSRTFQDQAVCQDPALAQSPVTTTGVKPSSTVEIQARYRQ